MRALRDGEGKLTGYVVINHELDRFAYVASHDLKAPLRAIANLAAWIEEESAGLPPAAQAYLAKLDGRVRRMDKLLDDLLAYARAGRVRHVPQFVDTRLLVQDAVEDLNVPPGFVVEVVAPLLAAGAPGCVATVAKSKKLSYHDYGRQHARRAGFVLVEKVIPGGQWLSRAFGVFAFSPSLVKKKFTWFSSSPVD